METRKKTTNNLSGLKDLTDKQLAALMSRAAKKAEIRSTHAHNEFKKTIEICVADTFEQWKSRINSLTEMPQPKESKKGALTRIRE